MNFEIIYKKVATNRVPGALSRKYEGKEDEITKEGDRTADLGALTRPIWQDWEMKRFRRVKN